MSICTMWPSFPSTCCLQFIIPTKNHYKYYFMPVSSITISLGTINFIRLSKRPLKFFFLVGYSWLHSTFLARFAHWELMRGRLVASLQFYLLISNFKKLQNWIWRLLFAENMILKLSKMSLPKSQYCSSSNWLKWNTLMVHVDHSWKPGLSPRF